MAMLKCFHRLSLLFFFSFLCFGHGSGHYGRNHTHAAFSQDGRLVVISYQSGFVKLFRVNNGIQIAEWDVENPISYIYLKNDQTVIAKSYTSSRLPQVSERWMLRPGFEPERIQTGPLAAKVYFAGGKAVHTRWDHNLPIGPSTGSTLLFQETIQKVDSIPEAPVFGLFLSRSRLEIQFWRRIDLQKLGLVTLSNPNASILLSANGQYLFELGNPLRIYEIDTGEQSDSIDLPIEPWHAQVSRTGRYFAFSDQNLARIWVFDWAEGDLHFNVLPTVSDFFGRSKLPFFEDESMRVFYRDGLKTLLWQSQEPTHWFQNNGSAYPLQISPNGDYILSAIRYYWVVYGGKDIARPRFEIRSTRKKPKMKFVATITMGTNGEVSQTQVVDREASVIAKLDKEPGFGSLQRLSFSADGRVVVASTGNRFYVIDLEKSESYGPILFGYPFPIISHRAFDSPWQILASNASYLPEPALSPQGRSVAWVTNKGLQVARVEQSLPILFKIPNPKPPILLSAPGERQSSGGIPSYSADGNWIVWPSHDRMTYIVEAETGQIDGALHTSSSVMHGAFSNDGEKIALGQRNGLVAVFERNSDQPLWEKDVGLRFVDRVAFSDKGVLLAVGFPGNKKYTHHASAVWIADSGNKLIGPRPAPREPLQALYIPGEETWLILGAREEWSWAGALPSGRAVKKPRLGWIVPESFYRLKPRRHLLYLKESQTGEILKKFNCLDIMDRNNEGPEPE